MTFVNNFFHKMAHRLRVELSSLGLESRVLPIDERCVKMVHTDVSESSCFALQANALPHKLSVDIKWRAVEDLHSLTLITPRSVFKADPARLSGKRPIKLAAR